MGISKSFYKFDIPKYKCKSSFSCNAQYGEVLPNNKDELKPKMSLFDLDILGLEYAYKNIIYLGANARVGIGLPSSNFDTSLKIGFQLNKRFSLYAIPYSYKNSRHWDYKVPNIEGVGYGGGFEYLVGIKGGKRYIVLDFIRYNADLEHTSDTIDDEYRFYEKEQINTIRLYIKMP